MTTVRSFPFTRWGRTEAWVGRKDTGWEREWQALPKWRQPHYLTVQTWNYLRFLPRMRWALIFFTWAGRNRSWLRNIWRWSRRNRYWSVPIHFLKPCWLCIKEPFLILLVGQAVTAQTNVPGEVCNTGPHWMWDSLLSTSPLKVWLYQVFVFHLYLCGTAILKS